MATQVLDYGFASPGTWSDLGGNSISAFNSAPLNVKGSITQLRLKQKSGPANIKFFVIDGTGKVVWVSNNVPNNSQIYTLSGITGLAVDVNYMVGAIAADSMLQNGYNGTNSMGGSIKYQYISYSSLAVGSVFNNTSIINNQYIPIEVTVNITTNKYLFQDGTDIKKYVSGSGLVDATPAMTGYNIPSSYVVSASSELTSSVEPAWKAFDKSTTLSPASLWESATGGLPAWIKMDLGTAQIIKGLTIKPFDGASNFCKSWSLQGSNDNSTWTTLTSGAKTSSSDYAVINVTFTNTTAYRYYRVYFTDSFNGNGIISIGDIVFLQDAPTGWQTIGTSPATKAMFDSNGMTDLSIVDNTAMQGLTSSSVDLLCWTDEIGATTRVSPYMTSDNVPSPFVASASTVDTTDGFYTWKAFSDPAAGYGGWGSAPGNLTGWVKIDLNSPVLVQQYILMGENYGSPTTAPKTWTLEGSNDDVTYIVLDTQTNVPAWTDKETRTYNFKNSTAYRYYRINISANQGHNNLVVVGNLQLMSVASPSRTANLTAVPVPQLLLPVGDMSIGELDSVVLNSTLSGSGIILVVASGDSGNTWTGNSSVNLADLTTVKANGWTAAQFNALTHDQLASLFPSGKARFAFYLEQSASTDTIQVNSLTVNERQYTLTPSADTLSVLYQILNSPIPTLYVSRDDGVTWKQVQPDQLTKLDDLPTGTRLRVKAVLQSGEELHGLSYSWV